MAAKKGTKKSNVVKTREKGINKIIKQDKTRVQKSTAVKGKGGRRGA